MNNDAWIRELSARTGAGVEQSDIDRLGQTNAGDDMDRLKQAYEAQYARRGASQTTGSGMDSSQATAMGYGSGRNENAENGQINYSNRPTGQPSGQAVLYGGSSGSSNASSGSSNASSGSSNASSGSSNASSQGGVMQERSDTLYRMLGDRASQSLTINRNDPVIRAQADAYGANTDRASRDYLSNVAESSGPYANLRGEQRMVSERAGQAKGGFEAELMGRELQSKRQEISTALTSMAGMLSGDQTRSLQMQLAQMDDAIARMGLDNQRRGQDFSQDQFLRELGLRQWQAGDDSDFRWAGLGG